MSIIWCGGEPIDFKPATAPILENAYAGTWFRAAFARGAIRANGAETNDFPAVATDLWFGARFSVEDRSANQTSIRFIGDDDGAIVVSVGSDVTESVFALKVNGTTVDTGGTIPQGTLGKLDVHVVYAVAGSVEVYLNTALILSYSGDTTVNSNTGIICMALANMGGGSADYTYFSEIIVADEDTRLMSLKTLAPNAAGDASEWTNGYASIDELGTDDSDTIYTDTAEKAFQCSLTGMPTGDYICKAVKMVARATDGVGGIGIQMGVKTNATVDLGSSITLGGVWENVEELYQQNPVTLNRFTPAEIDALQFAVKSVTV